MGNFIFRSLLAETSNPGGHEPAPCEGIMLAIYEYQGKQ